MFSEPVAIVDIETTGGSSRNSCIIEIAVLRIENGEIVQQFRSLVNPGIRIPEFITTITGIGNKDVEDAPYFEDIAHELSQIFEGAFFLAHYAVFDFSFIKKQMEGSGYSFRPRVLCSVKLSRALYPAYRSHSLDKVIQRHAIKVSNRHRAYDDAMAVHEFIKYAYAECGDSAFSEAVNRQLRLRSLPSNLDKSQLQHVKNVPGVYIFKGQNNAPVYIGKSVNLRNRILSHFAQATKESKELKISQNTHKLEVIETSSELEALLLESKLIKELLPIYNRKLRRKREQIILVRQTNLEGYNEIKIIESNVSKFARPQEIFGVYDTRLKAKDALQNARKTFDLCSKLLGLENSKGRCFYQQMGKCMGACVQEESPEIYNLRLDIAFERSRIASWKYKTPIVIQLDGISGLVVDHWKIVGKVSIFEDSETSYEELDAGFDLDNYKILRNYLAGNGHRIKQIDSKSLPVNC